MNEEYDLKINGVTMPTPINKGINRKTELIWSSNAGRVANGTFVGDIIAEKKTLAISWGDLTYAEFLTISNAISTVGRPFITISYKDATGQRVSFRGYTEGLNGTIVSYTDPRGRVSGVSLNVVQQ